MTKRLFVDDVNALGVAFETISSGGLVAVPTETVYGLAADATSGEAVARIYEAKGRPAFNPLIAHCCDFAMAEKYGRFSGLAKRCAEAFWPGALTLVVPYRPGAGLSDLARAGLETVALRVPKGPMANLVARLGHPLAAPSANMSGRISSTSAEHVMAQLEGRIDLVLDGGQCRIGVESTIVSFAQDKPVLLRPGGVAAEDIEEVLGVALLKPTGEGGITAPGMLASHYAPKAIVRLDATDIQGEDGALNFGSSGLEASYTVSLTQTGNLVEAAARLFSVLSDFDAKGVKKIAVAPIPPKGLGLAINDRLVRAAAPRVQE